MQMPSPIHDCRAAKREPAADFNAVLCSGGAVSANGRALRKSPGRGYAAILSAISCLLLLVPLHSAGAEDRRAEQLAGGRVKVTLVVEPAAVRLDRDMAATLRVESPSATKVEWPAITDRLQGFALSGVYDVEPETRDGVTIHERRLRLTPLVATEYRLAPMAIRIVDGSCSPPTIGWIATKAVVFAKQSLVDDPGTGIKSDPKPVWIAPGFRTVVKWMALATLVAAIGFGLWKLGHRVRRQVQLMRMSPRERAFHELSELLARDLIVKRQVKEFYLELTMIVRRYIERAHTIRAPEQTTEEFLAAASLNPAFTPEVMRKLRAFLQSADLVKFAAFQPPAGATDQATGTARDYISTDAAAQTPQGKEA
jgi:hypothetical protein